MIAALITARGLHLSDLRVGNSQTAATVTHHRVELVQGSDDVLDGLNGLALSLSKLLDVSFLGRNELMQRRIQETNGYRTALECFVQASRSRPAAYGSNLSKCSFSLFNGVGADHLAECCDSVCLEEHMLGTAEADTLSAELTCLLSVMRVYRRWYEPSDVLILVSPSHNTAELAGDGSVNGRDDAIIDVTG